MRHIFKEGIPLLLVAACVTVLALEMVAASAILITALCGMILISNPFNLLDNLIAIKARLCIGFGIMILLAGFSIPAVVGLNDAVTIFCVLVGFALVVLGAKANRTMMWAEERPMRQMYGKMLHTGYVDKSIAALRAGEKNYGPAMKSYKEHGRAQMRDLATRLGVPITEEELGRVGPLAWVLSAAQFNRQISNESQLQDQIRELREEAREREEELEQAYDSADRFETEVADYRRRFLDAADRARKYEAQLAQQKETDRQEEFDALTSEQVYDLLASGKWTCRTLADYYGTSASKVSRKQQEFKQKIERIKEMEQRY